MATGKTANFIVLTAIRWTASQTRERFQLHTGNDSFRLGEAGMTGRLFTCTMCFFALLAPVGLHSETFPYDHMHYGVPDPEKAVDWYLTNLNAKRGAAPDRVVFGRTIFAFAKTENPLPSAGSVIDHVAFSVADVDAKIRDLQAAGVKVVSPARNVPGLFKAGFIEDPWGAKIELVQDPAALGFHHIHLRVPDPGGSLKWYVDNFGGQRTRLNGRLDAVKYVNPQLWLIIEKSDDATPSRGHVIDHLGWAVPDVDAKIRQLASTGLKTVEARAVRNLRVGFVDGPAGVRIELVQGRTEEELVGR
ncbi:MAG TPA: VOC family protein [Vicinamibacterales bacterium]|nr:VOC family protein [Vicinamibacterales bacterium]